MFISEIVLQEAGAGDKEAAAQRLAILADLPLVALTEEAIALSEDLLMKGPLPPKANRDALHIAVAVVNGMDHLVTWNCAHIANAVWRNRIEAICAARGYEVPVICTPEELLGE